MEKNKTALVTGAASGLGYEFAKLLAKDCYNMVLVDIDAEKLSLVQQELTSLHPITVTTLVIDLSMPNVADQIMLRITGTIHVLINNAGFGLFGAFTTTNWKREEALLMVSVVNATHLAKLVLQKMVKQGYGKVLNMASMAAFQPGPLMSLYYASKAYMLSFSEAIANELKGTGVTVTVLCPGPTKTSFQETVSQGTKENKIKFNMATAPSVVNYGYQAMLKGKVVAIPGFMNKFLSILPRVLPRNLATAIVRKIQEKNRAD